MKRRGVWSSAPEFVFAYFRRRVSKTTGVVAVIGASG